MLPQERYKLITDYLENHNIIKIEQMLDMFDISIETARRDLTYMEKQGLIKKIYGGATLVKREAGEPENSERLEKKITEKTAIAKKCADFINDGDTILLEVGTTTLQVAKAIKTKKNLTVISNSIHIINELMSTNFQLYIIGGHVRQGEGSVSGAVSMLELEHFNIGKAILSAGGITVENGLSDYNIEEALMRKKVIDQSEEVIVVADSSKFGKDVLTHVCPITAVTLVITDEGLAPQQFAKFQEANVNLVFA